ncbi:transposase [Streptococcus pneumoniae]|nr:transposase [Streptococcus pneumoniae]
MHIHYNTNQTTLPLEISSFLPQDHLVFTIEKVVNTLEDCHFHAFYHAFDRLSYHLSLYLLFYLPIHKGFSLVEKLKNGRVSDLRLFVY